MPANQPRSHQQNTENEERYAQGGLFRLVQSLTAALLAARLLLAPESSIYGETLWIVQLWFITAGLWAWDGYRRRDFRLRLGWIDAAFWMVVVGHAVSAGVVFANGGDRRAAVNLTWEWVGLGVSFFLLRQTLRTRAEAGRMLALMVAVTTGLASLGIWQHYVWQPRMAANYATLRATAEDPAAPPLERREAFIELQKMGVPIDGPARMLFENRLRATEPFGTFALANTFAGFLAAWIVVAGVALVQQRTRSWKWCAAIGCVVIVAMTIVLTKSRTAWLALVGGGFVWAVLIGIRNVQFSKRLWFTIAMVCTGVVGLFVSATFTGGFDREVISEAPKSFLYRWQYWRGAAGVVKEHPVWGVGPGNFRHHYLEHKLPEASEEIADPHNFVLDLWTSSGCLGLLAFGAFLILFARQSSDNRLTDDPPNDGESSPRAISLGVVAGLGAVCLGKYWLSGLVDESIIGASIVTLCTLWLWAAFFPKPTPGRSLIVAAVVLLIHLLGAGGIEMPGVTQNLVVLAACASWTPFPEESPIGNPLCVLALGCLGLIACGLCAVTATLPVMKADALVLRGDAERLRSQFTPVAEEFYQQASIADPLATQPVRRLAELHAGRWQLVSQDPERHFKQAVGFLELLIEQNPQAPHTYRRLGQLYQEHGDRLNRPESYKRAARAYRSAVERYPHLAALRAEYALLLEKSGDRELAASQAAIALGLDDLNRAAGHQERFLSNKTREELSFLRDGM